MNDGFLETDYDLLHRNISRTWFARIAPENHSAFLFILCRTTGCGQRQASIKLREFSEGAYNDDGRQFHAGVNLNEQRARRAIKNLERAGCIETKRTGNRITFWINYSFMEGFNVPLKMPRERAEKPVHPIAGDRAPYHGREGVSIYNNTITNHLDKRDDDTAIRTPPPTIPSPRSVMDSLRATDEDIAARNADTLQRKADNAKHSFNPPHKQATIIWMPRCFKAHGTPCWGGGKDAAILSQYARRYSVARTDFIPYMEWVIENWKMLMATKDFSWLGRKGNEVPAFPSVRLFVALALKFEQAWAVKERFALQADMIPRERMIDDAMTRKGMTLEAAERAADENSGVHRLLEEAKMEKTKAAHLKAEAQLTLAQAENVQRRGQQFAMIAKTKSKPKKKTKPVRPFGDWDETQD